ncbi:MAG: TRAP transporter small permease [Methylobacteriaceae bacterium]|nr:TRAP transporter small permease [Methylobacteriaceae bacterium]
MTAFASALARALAPIAAFALWLSAAGLVAMTGFVAWQIFGRYILNDSPSWTEPGALLLMSWFIVLGAAVGVREGDHMGFDVGLHYAPPGARLAMQALTFVLVLGFGLAMAWYGFELTAGTWNSKMAGVDMPQGMEYLPLVGGGLLIGLFSLEKLAQLFAGNDLMADKSGRAGLE